MLDFVTAFQIIVVFSLCIFLDICLIVYRNKISNWAKVSTILVQLGLIFVTAHKVMLILNIFPSLEKLVWILIWVTTIPGLAIILIGGYFKGIRYNPKFKRLFLILIGVMMFGVLLFIFASIMEKITG